MQLLDVLSRDRVQTVQHRAGGGTFGRQREHVRIGGPFEDAVPSGHKFQLFGPRIDEASPVCLEQDVASVECPEMIRLGANRLALAADY